MEQNGITDGVGALTLDTTSNLQFVNLTTTIINHKTRGLWNEIQRLRHRLEKVL